MQRLAQSQAERFGIDIVPFHAGSAKTGALPSFAYKINESMRLMATSRAVGGQLKVMRVVKKTDGFEFARRCGVEVPRRYVDATDIDDFDWSVLPDRVCIKPIRGAASRGVFLLQKTTDGDYIDHMTSERVTQDGVMAALRTLVDDGRVDRRLLAEELLEPHPSVADVVAIPDDLKVFAFYDHPAVVMQRRCFGSKDLSKYRFRFWDADWNDLGPVKYADRLDPAMTPPVLRDEVIDVVRTLGRGLAVPFARIDVYETARGVVFGEITPHPGPPAGWRADLDRLLGYEWEIAQARLGAGSHPTIVPK